MNVVYKASYPAGIVHQVEAGLVTEVGLRELRVPGMLGNQLVHQRCVCRLREPTLLIHEGQDAHGLQTTTSIQYLQHLQHSSPTRARISMDNKQQHQCNTYNTCNTHHRLGPGYPWTTNNNLKTNTHPLGPGYFIWN